MSGIIYGCTRILFIVLGRMFFGLGTIGRHHVPRDGGLLVAANHASYLDIPILGCGLPRRVSFLGRQDLFPIPLVHGVLRWLGWIPIRLDRLDRVGVGKAVSLIKAGNVVAIYPEGSRSRDGRLKPGKPGIGVIVAETGCPVLPVYIGGSYEVLPFGASWPRRHPLWVVIGEPIDFSSGVAPSPGKEFYQLVSRTVMARIADLGQVAHPKGASSRGEQRQPAERHQVTERLESE